jgi:hypothetical protein
MKKIILLFLVITLSSCMKAAFLIYGVHKPKPLTLDQMNRKYEKRGYTDYPIFVFKDSTSYYDFLANKRRTVNGVYIFNRDGLLVSPRVKMTCSSDNDNYLSHFYQTDSMVIDSSFSISLIENGTRLIQNNCDSKMRDSSKAYDIVLCFADFAGRVNKQSTTEYIQQLKESDSLEFNLSLLSLDPLKK